MASRNSLIGCGALAVIGVVLFILIMWGMGVYNGLIEKNENVNQTWSQVENQYQRRADLIPNLVETVKGYANFEKEILTEVTQARASASSIQATPELLNDPQAFQRFQDAQANLSGALSRLLVTVENYPELKSNENFLQLQSQLEGTENRISVERRNFNNAVQDYNTTVKRFPANIFAGMFGFNEKPYFEATTPNADTAPKVEF